MTQLIGAICEDGEKLILIADRMVTTADESLAFEHGPKFEVISPTALVLTAGTIHEPEIIANAKSELKGKAPLVEIAESLAKHYRRMRRKRIEHEILEEMGLESFDEFLERQRLLHENTVLELNMRIKEYDLGLHLLLGGVDEKAHLYRIGEPGTYRSWDELGFCCVGRGDRHAEPVFAFYEFSPQLSVEKVLQIAFIAKKRAEMAGGVGQNTDAWILQKGGIYEVTSETIQRLEQAYRTQEDISRYLQTLQIETKKVEYPGS